MLGQNFPVPYNPDGDTNGLIGTPDLLSLLALFGEEFSAAVVSDNEELATLFMGSLPYPVCAQSCKNLPGHWQIASLEDLGLVWNEVSAQYADTWIKQPSEINFTGGVHYLNEHFGAVGLEVDQSLSSKKCFCAIQQLPRVEYSFCSAASDVRNVQGGTTPSSLTAAFQDCCDEKVESGWYPLGGFSKGQSTDAGQAFWRWAE